MTEMKTLTIGGTTYEVVDDKAREDIKKLQEAEPTDGEDGGHYTPSVVDNGDGTMTISFTASKEGMAAVNPVTITLPAPADGEDGQDGQDGANGKDGENGGYYTPTVETVTENSFKISFSPSKSGMPSVGDVTITLPTAKDGEDGKDGTNGTNGVDGVGIKSITKTSTSGLVDTYTITLTNNTTATFTVTNGEDGADGKDGTNGVDGKDGDPYTLTPADKAEIVQAVIESLGGQPVAGYFDEDNNIVLTSALPDGDYTVKYEMGENTYTLGTVTVKTTVNKYTVTFVADGVTVATVEYEEGATSLDGVPDVPAKSGYTGEWEAYTLNNTNITVNAVYTEVVVEPSYTNLLNGVTIEEGMKLSTSSGGTKAQTGACATDFIAIPAGRESEVLRIYNVSLHTDASVNNIVFYDENMTKIGYWVGVAGAFSANVNVDNKVYSFTPNSAYASTRYIRFSCGNIDSNSIVTLGEEIE